MIEIKILFDPKTASIQLQPCPLPPVDVLGVLMSIQGPLLAQVKEQLPKLIVPVAAPPGLNGGKLLDLNRLRDEPKPE